MTYKNLLVTVAPPAGYTVTNVKRDGDELVASIVFSGNLNDCIAFVRDNMSADTRLPAGG